MTRTEISVRVEGITATATVNGRAKYPVRVGLRENPKYPLALNEINLASADERAKFADLVPPSEREVTSRALMQLAAKVVAAAPPTTHKEKRADLQELFPIDEPAPEAIDGADLLDDLEKLVRRFVVLPAHAPVAVTLWIAHTYLVDVADFTPYLLVTSPVRECGKTTLLELLERLAFRGMMTGGISPAALYRIIDKHEPTMLLDELDTRLKLRESAEALRNVLNTGFQRGGKMTICVGDDHEVKSFRTFGPKVLAGIGHLWDTVTSRSIPIRLAKATKGELGQLEQLYSSRIGGVCGPYRRELLRWATDVRDHARDLEPEIPRELGARQGDVWGPLLAIAALAGEEWPARARTAALALHGAAEEEGDLGLLLLADMRSVFAEHHGADRLSTLHIVQELARRDDRPWPEFNRGRGLSARSLSSLLSRFGVKSTVYRTGGDQLRGYLLAGLEPVFERYLTPPGQPVTSVTPLTEATPGGVTDVTDNSGGASDLFDDRGEAWEPAL